MYGRRPPLLALTPAAPDASHTLVNFEPNDQRSKARTFCKRSVAGIVAGAALLLASSPVAARAAAAPVTNTPAISGVTAAAAWGLGGSFSQTQYNGMASEDVSLVRNDASWSAIEPNPPGPSGPVFDFGSIDPEVTMLAVDHLTWLPVLDYSAPWAASVGNDPFSPPASDSDFAAYAQAVAARYGAGGSFWAQNPQLPYEPVTTFEVWNEENGGYFWDTGSQPAAYGKLYAATRTAIKSTDPSAEVIVGGLVEPSADQFVTQMLSDDPSLRGNVDGFGLHPYDLDGDQVVADVQSFRKTLDGLGESAAPIDVTEFGWEYDSAPGDETWRADQMQEVAEALGNSDCGVQQLDPYSWVNDGGPDWGLADTTGAIRPAGAAWFTGLAVARSRPMTTLCASSSSTSTSRAKSSVTSQPKAITASFKTKKVDGRSKKQERKKAKRRSKRSTKPARRKASPKRS